MTEESIKDYMFLAPDRPVSTEVSKESKISGDSSAKSEVSDSAKGSTVSVPYMEPEWSGSPPPNYCFEVIKNGTIISNINFNKSFLIVGRLPSCDIALEHPSVSRFHAVLQFCNGDDTHPRGFYVYDLESTHGSFLNKKKLDSKIYYRIKVGHVLKFGGSTRLHIFQGPEEVEEEVPKVSENDESETVCSWGITEDADDESDLTENPFALSTANEDLYLDDPKKTLSGWFEREGYDLEYNVEEKGFKTFVCHVRLPIDNPSGEDYVMAEASVNGKKKEAVVACALEACRILDRQGLLRQAEHESHQRKKKNWEDQDYYDSDEDPFLDRTGVIEKKREKRKSLDKKSEVETFYSLQQKLKLVNQDINEIEQKLQAISMNKKVESESGEVDSLENFMSTMNNQEGGFSDKVTKSKLRLRLTELVKEKSRLEKLLNIAQPTKLPPVSKFPIIGKRLKTKLSLPVSKPPVVPAVVKNEPEVEEEEEDSDGDKVLNESKTKVEEECSRTRISSSLSEKEGKISDKNLNNDIDSGQYKKRHSKSEDLIMVAETKKEKT